MKKRIVRITGCIITACLAALMLLYLTNLMELKDSRNRYRDFFAQHENFDVLFFGSSHVINAVFPMELWKDYGIVSYNCGGHANPVPTSYWVMENALEYTDPKVVVIDCFGIMSYRKSSDVFSFLHHSFDAFPLSITKIKAILDLMDDPALEEEIAAGETRESPEARTIIGLLWNYSVYHSRWNELEEEDFDPAILYEKGAESRIAVNRAKFERIEPEEKMDQIDTTGILYLKKMIEDCRQRGIQVLLTYLPFPANEDRQREADYVYDLAEEYGVNYINFLDLDLINFQTDLYDESSHVNPSGARKITDYLGRYLVDNYDVPDSRDNTDYSFWNEDYEEYIQMKNDNLVSRKGIVEYLMLLSGDDVDITMDVRNKEIFKNEWIVNLLGNIGIDTSELDERTDFIIFDSRTGTAEVLKDFRHNGDRLKTEAGLIKYAYSKKNNSYSLTVDDKKRITGKADDKAGLGINVERDGNTVDSVRFIYSIDPETKNVNMSDVIRE